MGKDDSTSAALSRAKSYFLVSAMVGNSLTFAIGPKLLDDEESPDKKDKDSKNQNDANGNHENDDEERRRVAEEEEHNNPTNSEGRTAEEEEEHDNETTTLLPDSVARHASRYRQQVSEEGEHQWVKLPKKMQWFLGLLDGFLNAPLIGAVIGAIVGLVAPIHRLFFSDPQDGGYFKAWLTQSVNNVGELFPALQLVVVGAKLSGALTKMKKGENSGTVPWIPMLSIFFIRFILWPV
jgi:predicted permease